MKPAHEWSTGDKIAFVALIFGGIAAIAAVLVVPELRCFLRLDDCAKYKPEEAGNLVGKYVRICGAVTSANYAPQSQGRPTFLSFGGQYPHQVFTVVIWGEDRSKFGDPEKDYLYKKICVDGTVVQGPTVPEIVARDPKQIKLER